MNLMKIRERKQKTSFLCMTAMLSQLLLAGICGGGNLAADEKKKKKQLAYDPTSAYEIRED